VNFKETSLDFVQHRNKYFLTSSFIIGLGLLFIAIFGLNLGVDFVSGTTLEILIENQAFTEVDVRTIVEEAGYSPGSVTLAGNRNEFAMVKFPEVLIPDQINEIETAVAEVYGRDNIDLGESTVTPIVAKELARLAVICILLASVGVIIYVTFRFEYRFAIAAVVALFHDALLIVAIFSILRIEVDLTFIAAVLTIVGYSINDTIVIFDRIRENLRTAKIKGFAELAEVVNQSIRDTLARSINTSLTVVFAAAAIFFLGGEGIRNFSFALMVGLLAGAYSSIFIAAQLWLVLKWNDMKKKLYQSQTEG